MAIAAAWLVRRLAAAIAIVLAVVTITFFLIHLAPGSPCGESERQLSPEVCRRLRAQFGYDRPLAVQYVKYLWALSHGDLGESFALHRPVADALADAIPNTLTLAGAALLIDFVLGLAPEGAPGRPGARAAQRAVAVHHVVRTGVPVPAHRRGAGGDGVRVVGDGPPLGHGDLPARLPRGHRLRAGGEWNGGAGEPVSGRALRRGRSQYSRAQRGDMSALTWLALAGAVAVALLVAEEAHRRAAVSAAGRRFLRHPTATPGVFILAFFVTLATAAPLLAPYDPAFQIDIVHLQNHAPSAQNILGTDVYSRDVWSRLVYGARISLGIGTIAMLVAVTAGRRAGGGAGGGRGLGGGGGGGGGGARGAPAARGAGAADRPHRMVRHEPAGARRSAQPARAGIRGGGAGRGRRTDSRDLSPCPP